MLTGPTEALSAHASTECQPQQAQGLVPNLSVAGLSNAHATDSGGWECTLAFPAIYEAGDGHPFFVTATAASRRQVIQEFTRQN